MPLGNTASQCGADKYLHQVLLHERIFLLLADPEMVLMPQLWPCARRCDMTSIESVVGGKSLRKPVGEPSSTPLAQPQCGRARASPAPMIDPKVYSQV
jgi:hypothetical protein